MEPLLNNLIQATGWSILHSLWQGALIYALLLPTQMNVFRLSAKLKYKLAYAANCLMLISFVFTFLSVFQWPSTVIIPLNSQNLPISAIEVFIKYAEQIFPLLASLYTAGLVIQTFIVLQGYKKVQQLKKASFSVLPEEWKALFEGLIKNLNIKRKVDFRLSEHVNVPLVIGFLRPVILFPIALAAQMDIKHVEAILIHELSHIRRNDYLFNLIRTIIDTILFFNPFIWLTNKFINIEREHACDDLVIKLTHTPLTYAHALLKLELLTDQHYPALSLAATGTNQHLYQRIKRITDMKTTYMNSKQKLFTVTLTLATIVSLAWISPENNDKHFKKITVQNNRSTMLSDLSPLDTGKKKSKNQEKVKEISIINTNNSIVPPPPPVEPNAATAPDSHLAPPPPPVEPGSATGSDKFSTPPPPPPVEPGQPEAPEIVVNMNAPVAPELSKAITNYTIQVKDMAMAVGNVTPVQLDLMSKEVAKSAMQLQKEMTSLDQRTNWQKYAKDMQAKYNTPEQRAKWEKYGKDMQAKYNSPEYKKQMLLMRQDVMLQMKEVQKAVVASRLRMRSANLNQTMPVMVITENSDQQKIKETAEYKELKKKFDKDVEDLAAKKLKKDNN